MAIAQFIRAHIAAILDEWEQFARSLPIARKLSREALRDHARGILLAIADDLEREQSAAQAEVKSKGGGVPVSPSSAAGLHGADRLVEGFTVNDAMSEYRALRACIVRLWTQQAGTGRDGACADLIRFNEAIDQALTDSLDGYSDDRERRGRLYDTLLSVSPDLSFVVDHEARLVYGNAALASEVGAPLSALRGQRLADLNGFRQSMLAEHVAAVFRTRAATLGEFTRQRSGRPVTYEYLLVPVGGAEEAVEAVAGIARDISQRKATEEKYRRGAHYDDLTGLPNRNLFSDRLHHEIERARRLGLPLALMFIDLDGFKQVNDLLGHQAGDELLRQAAARLRGCVRGADTVARLAGDEFTVILSEIRHMPHVYVLAQHILDELAREFTLGERKVVISASLGVAISPQDGADAAVLLRHADQAMYAAKQAGRNRYCLFTPEMRHAAWQRRARVAELRQAMALHQLKVLYQPIVALADRAVIGAEAQLCWQHPQQGLLASSSFADLAAEAGLTGELDGLVMADALSHAKQWADSTGTAFPISIESASFVFDGAGSGPQVRAIMDQLPQAGAPVALEVTEDMLLSDAPGGRAMLAQLASAGVMLTLDNFGSGRSALASLTSLPLAGLRLAPALVRDLAQTMPRSLALGIIAACHGMGLMVVAEGVATPEQANCLLELDCDYAQGDHFYRPMAPEALHSLIVGPQP
ncbi:diguanylate cyclase [Massilia sp. PAMC28688]|uniref:putative bifunctional diguanylate cyclase/phosphodiesterase n=1 Tax=Massilia sp. PAMC28688 TaxID=2861283 RepID=UPI001C638EB1|nr:diguanylate cyclase [Massilia sp. PAMC28688]QYF92132.1 diguanylate cyclase [Massilia sp. PAMC28688]